MRARGGGLSVPVAEVSGVVGVRPATIGSAGCFLTMTRPMTAAKVTTAMTPAAGSHRLSLLPRRIAATDGDPERRPFRGLRVPLVRKARIFASRDFVPDRGFRRHRDIDVHRDERAICSGPSWAVPAPDAGSPVAVVGDASRW